MAKSKNQNLKILYIADYFRKYSDKVTPVSAGDIKDFLLTEKGISAEEHSIYRDIALLRDEYIPEEGCDFKIENKRGGYYYLVERPIEFEDLQLIKDAVASMTCISKDKEKSLQEKLNNLGTKEQNAVLSVDTKFYNRTAKTDKELLSNISSIKSAIAYNHKISFRYMKYKVDEMPKKIARHRGIRYHISPFEIFYKDGNYYTIGYEKATDRINIYRVDRIKDLKIETEERIGFDEFKKLDVESYLQNSFNLFVGEPCQVRIEFSNHLIDAVADKFGTEENVSYDAAGTNTFILEAKVDVSPQFYAWVCGFGTDARIIAPENVVQGMKDFLNKVCVLYESGEE